MRVQLEGAPTTQISPDGTQIMMGDWTNNSSQTSLIDGKKGMQTGLGVKQSINSANAAGSGSTNQASGSNSANASQAAAATGNAPNASGASQNTTAGNSASASNQAAVSSSKNGLSLTADEIFSNSIRSPNTINAFNQMGGSFQGSSQSTGGSN